MNVEEGRSAGSKVSELTKKFVVESVSTSAVHVVVLTVTAALI